MGPFTLISGLNALAALLLFALYGAILLGHARQLSHNVLVQTANDWQALATSRLAISEGLQKQLDAIQSQVTRLAERLATMEHDNQALQRLNQRLQVGLERLLAENESLREQLAEAGVPLPSSIRTDRLRELRLLRPEEGTAQTSAGEGESHEPG
jgi:septal ring factor EnvC (AmiA/AmiB activator)